MKMNWLMLIWIYIKMWIPTFNNHFATVDEKIAKKIQNDNDIEDKVNIYIYKNYSKNGDNVV